MRVEESLEVKLPNTDRSNIVGEARDMREEESSEVKLPNTDWSNIAGEARDMRVEENLDVAHPLLIDAITRAQPALCRQR